MEKSKKENDVSIFSGILPGILPLLLLVFAAACVSDVTRIGLSSGTLEMKMSADPEEVFIDALTNVYVDVSNNDVKTLENVEINVFDAGVMSKGDCRKSLSQMQPNQSFTLRCELRAPLEITESVAENRVHARASYKTTLGVFQEIDFITPDWFERQRILGLQTRQRKFVYADKNIEATVEFSDPMPFVVRENKKYYMYITVENIGKGTIMQLKDDDIKIEQSGKITDCTFQTVYVVGRKFPRVACEIKPPKVDTQRTEALILKIGYNYDIRSSTIVKIKK